MEITVTFYPLYHENENEEYNITLDREGLISNYAEKYSHTEA